MNSDSVNIPLLVFYYIIALLVARVGGKTSALWLRAIKTVSYPVVNALLSFHFISFHFISFYLFTAYEDVTQLVKDNTT